MDTEWKTTRRLRVSGSLFQVRFGAAQLTCSAARSSSMPSLSSWYSLVLRAYAVWAWAAVRTTGSGLADCLAGWRCLTGVVLSHTFAMPPRFSFQDHCSPRRHRTERRYTLPAQIERKGWGSGDVKVYGAFRTSFLDVFLGFFLKIYRNQESCDAVRGGPFAPPTSNGHAIPGHVNHEVPSKRRRKAPTGPGANPPMLRHGSTVGIQWLGHCTAYCVLRTLNRYGPKPAF